MNPHFKSWDSLGVQVFGMKLRGSIQLQINWSFDDEKMLHNSYRNVCLVCDGSSGGDGDDVIM
jgi:hypothetical protein